MKAQILTLTLLFAGIAIVQAGESASRRYFNSANIEAIKSKATTWVPFEEGQNPLRKYTDDQLDRMLGGLRVPGFGTMWQSYFNKKAPHGNQHPNREMSTLKTKLTSIPTSFDARTEWPSCIHSVRDQGSCGSCWAFATSGFIEDRFCIASGGAIDVRMSPQDMVSCDFQNGACNGGWLSTSLNYLITDGILSETCLPYSSSGGSSSYCKFQCDDSSTDYTKYYCSKGSMRLFTTTEDIQQDIMDNGPLMVGFIVYEDFLSYSTGIYQYTSGSVAGGHAVKMLGWNYDGSGNLYWICQNQWDSTWGDSGYFNIYSGQVGIDSVGFSCTPDLE